MKKLILIFSLMITFKAQAQVVFCPPGAEWHYLFNGTIFFPGNTYNETIKYTGDTIDGIDTVKILSHVRFFMACGLWPYPRVTYIKQKADTIYFKNSLTSGTWQVLFNFAALPGQSWHTTLKTSSTGSQTFTTTVNSISTITVNGFALKQLNVSNTGAWSGGIITERFGGNLFLFNFSYRTIGSCDGDWLLENLCYTDSVFGTHQYGEHGCWYSTVNVNGLFEGETISDIRIYPNPSANQINLEFNRSVKNLSLQVMNAFGQIFYLPNNEFENGKFEVEVSKLESGIYFLKLFENDQLVGTHKIIKQ
jgi:hypothetical protein